MNTDQGPEIVWCDAHNPPGTPTSAATAHAMIPCVCRYPHDVGPRVRAEYYALAAERLRRDLDQARPGDDVEYLVEHLAAYGPEGLDVRALARAVLDRREQE